MVANAVLIGTVSEIGGGKFANGAVTGAFAMMFNDMMHQVKDRMSTNDRLFVGNNRKDITSVRLKSHHNDSCIG